jgi:hypothetical protein
MTDRTLDSLERAIVDSQGKDRAAWAAYEDYCRETGREEWGEWAKTCRTGAGEPWLLVLPLKWGRWPLAKRFLIARIMEAYQRFMNISDPEQ